jgi:hypothetical protein
LATDPHLSDVYRPYLKRIQSNSLLYIAILANGAGLFKEARKYLMKAAMSDLGLLGRGRFWRVARRALLGLQPK